MKFIGTTDEYFEMTELGPINPTFNNEVKKDMLTLLWFEEPGSSMVVDTQAYTFKANQIICLTGFHKVESSDIRQARVLQFNSPFYCILNHDSEVGCKGVLFFGSSDTPVLSPVQEDVEKLDLLWKVFLSEMKSSDNLQLEMLQMLLKRLLILCTRIYKSQGNFKAIDKGQIDIVREFNFLVEQHFREKHSVSEYANLLNKSPKTLSNLFGKLHDKSPLQLIQNRIMLEVRRMLRYTDKPVSEIGYEVGFNDIQSFSRFFKKNEGVSPSDFRVTPAT